MYCERCDAEAPLRLPAPAQSAILQIQAFCVEHAKCGPLDGAFKAIHQQKPGAPEPSAMSEPSDDLPKPPEPCQAYMMRTQTVYPRSCPTCQLGPCRFGIEYLK